MKCSICDNEMNLIEVLNDVWNTTDVVDDYSDASTIDVSFFTCPECRHAMIEEVLPSDFYEEFSMSIVRTKDDSLIEKKLQDYDCYIQRLLELNQNNREGFLEIGSGGGYLLYAASKKFAHVLGVEPSKFQFKASQKITSSKDNIHIINGYWDRSLGINDSFSAFAAIMTLEHIKDVRESLRYASDLLVGNGVGYIQVPNGMRTYDRKVMFDIFPQHIHYFTISSLARLAVECSLEIIEIRESKERNYLEMYVRKSIKCESTFKAKLEKQLEEIRDYIEHHNTVSVWGASYIARGILKGIDSNRIRHFYDMSEVKSGKYIAGFPVKIEEPSKKTINDSDLMIILATDYKESIMKKLCEFGYVGGALLFNRECSIEYRRMEDYKNG